VVVPKDRDKDARWLIETIQHNQVVSLNLVPSMLAMLLLQDEMKNCTSLKQVFTVGERLPVSVQREFFKQLPQAKLYVFYGTTEAPSATFREIQPDEDYGDRVILGKPMVNKKIYLLDKHGVPVPIGVPGEIHVGGSISRGYIHNESLTKERFIPNPFTGKLGDRMYQTGDLARYLPDGNIEYLGRTDFQVQIRGIRIELGEIEACLSSHPRICDTVVIAHSRSDQDTILVAYFTPGTGEVPPVKDLRKHVHTRLPDYMVPSLFIQLDAFPLNTSGKIDRKT
jgi:non-ribosomal peptide synthetase component F